MTDCRQLLWNMNLHCAEFCKFCGEIMTSLQVLIFFQHEKRNFISSSGHVMFYLLYKHQWTTKPFHFNSFFGVKGAIYFVVTATVIFSHVKVTCYFHMWRYQVLAKAHLVFHWCLYNKTSIILILIYIILLHNIVVCWKDTDLHENSWGFFYLLYYRSN